MKVLICVVMIAIIIVTGCSSPPAASTTKQQTPTQQTAATAKPNIAVSPQSFSVEFTEGETETVNKTLAVLNDGGGVMQWAATKTQKWLWLTDANGALEKGYSKNVSIAISGSGLAAGTYTDTISVEGMGAANSPVSVKVTIVVKPAPVAATSSGSAAQARQAAPLPPWEYDEWTNSTYNLRLRYPKEYTTKMMAGAPFGAVANNGKPNSDIILIMIEGAYGVDYMDVITEFSKDAIHQLGGKPNPKVVSVDNQTMLSDGVTPAYEVVINSKSTATTSYEVYVFGFKKSNRYIFFGGCIPLNYSSERMQVWKEIAKTLEMTG